MLVVSYLNFLFLQVSYNLKTFERNWFLVAISFCKPGVIHHLFQYFNFIFRNFLRSGQVDKTFQGKCYEIVLCLCLMKTKDVADNQKIIKCKIFLIKS